jgi:hypothetical protein
MAYKRNGVTIPEAVPVLGLPELGYGDSAKIKAAFKKWCGPGSAWERRTPQRINIITRRRKEKRQEYLTRPPRGVRV